MSESATTINFNGMDRITRTAREIGQRNGQNVVIQRTSIWTTENSGDTYDISIVETSADGLQSWHTEHGVTTHTQVTYDGQGGRTVTITNPDDSYRIEEYVNGRLMNVASYGADDFQLSGTVYSYDAHGRVASEIDARNGATVYLYDGADRPVSIARPENQTTLIEYDSRGRQKKVTHPDGGIVHTIYYPTGEMKRIWGSRTYPVEYTYDPQGRMRTMTTWQDFAGDSGKAVTTWTYHPDSGLLASKEDDDGKGVSYTYDSFGRLESRTWARSSSAPAWYYYNMAGDLSTISYWDSTPDVSLSYDRAGHLKQVSDAFGGREIEHSPDGRLLFEEGVFGLDSHFVYDALNRLERVDFRDQSTQAVVFSHDYGYDSNSGRLETVGTDDHQVEYGYHANSELIQSISFMNNSASVLTAARGYDSLNRLTSIASGPMEYVYQYNAANQRTRVDWADGSRWSFDYDDLGQVISANRFWSGGIPVEGQQFGYSFDDIGNRTETSRNDRIATYQPNLLNQIVKREIPGAVDIMGHAHPEATVTVNLKNTTRQDGGYFHREAAIANDEQAASEEVRIVGVRNAAGPNGEDVVSEVTGEAFLPADPEIFIYDDDGNLIEDGLWTYSWDAENRLIAMEARLELSSLIPRQRLEFGYDWQGRRIRKTVKEYVGTWQTLADRSFHYHGWNLVAELDDKGTVEKSYLWGLDLSGTLEGAGGVGGLLAIRDHAENAVYYTAYDGNGNVTGLIDSADVSVAAIYEYGPFGEAIRASGPAADTNPFSFSTKYFDAESELYYYGYRYYNSDVGRWLNRDPIKELGGASLYGFVGNDSINRWDYLGLTGSVGCDDLLDSPEFQALPPQNGVHISIRGSIQGCA